MKRIYQTTVLAEVRLLQMALDQHDIEAEIENENLAFQTLGLPSAAVPLGLLVADEDEAEARAVVEEVLRERQERAAAKRASGADSLAGGGTGGGAPSGWRGHGGLLAFGALLLAFVAGIVLVPISRTVRAWSRAASAAAAAAAPAQADPRVAELKDLLLQRCDAIADPPLPTVDVDAACADLARELPEAAARLRERLGRAATFDDLVTAWLRETCDLDPDWALEIGLADTPALTHHTREQRKTRALLAGLLLQALRRLQPPAEALEARLLDRSLEGSLVRFTLLGPDPVNPDDALSGVAACGALVAPVAQPGEREFQLIAERLERIPAQVAEVRAALRAPDATSIQEALDRVDGTLELLRACVATASGATPGVQARLDLAVRAATPAIEDYRTFLDGLLPKAAPRPHATAHPPFARYLFARVEFSDRPLREVAGFLKEIARIDRERAAALPPEDPRARRPTRQLSEEEYLEEWRKEIPWVLRFARAEGFPEWADASAFEVRATPSWLRNNYRLAGCWDRPCAPRVAPCLLVTPRGGRRVVDTAARRTSLRALLAARAFPGLLLQREIERRHASMIARLYPSRWLEAGWGFRVENQVCDRESQADRETKARQDWEEERRTWLALVDLAFSLGRFDETETAAFLTEVLGLTPESARDAADRMERYPLASLAPVLGAREIRSLHDDLKHRLGQRFTEKEFAERLLGFGRTPLALVRAEMERGWR